jgi:hypothetical protein
MATARQLAVDFKAFLRERVRIRSKSFDVADGFC